MSQNSWYNSSNDTSQGRKTNLQQPTYVCIDLKSFYASVECVERGYDPFDVNLVVADQQRTDKTICLAVSPALKTFGVPGRIRLFEVKQRVKQLNNQRLACNNYKPFTAKSCCLSQLNANANLQLDFVVAPPRMALYMQYSTLIYSIYLKYVAKEDIHVYSIDEVFMDVTHYLDTYKLSAQQLAKKIIKDVLATTGITATVGIGTNMYLAKVAMDIVAKHVDADSDGVRIATLDEQSYRKELWSHTPLTDFWRVGKGYATKLARIGCRTMGDIARLSTWNEDVLYKLFGVNAELLIDHAWGYEPTTIALIKSYKPTSHSLSSGQVLHSPYDYDSAKLVAKEMADQLSLDLAEKKMYTDCLWLTIGYDVDNDLANYDGVVVTDYLGRQMPKPSHGLTHLAKRTCSTKQIVARIAQLYDDICNKNLLVRRINVACSTFDQSEKTEKAIFQQLDLFGDAQAQAMEAQKQLNLQQCEQRLQQTVLNIKQKYGKNSIVKAMNLEKNATMMQRNCQIGGHHQ